MSMAVAEGFPLRSLMTTISTADQIRRPPRHEVRLDQPGLAQRTAGGVTVGEDHRGYARNPQSQSDRVWKICGPHALHRPLRHAPPCMPPAPRSPAVTSIDANRWRI
jgi:hypothetical protein